MTTAPEQDAITLHGDPAEVEATEAAAESAIATQQPGLSQQMINGQRVRLMITTKDYLPGKDSKWPIRMLAAEAAGTSIRLGTLSGYVTKVEYQEHAYNGKMLPSYWLHGQFKGEVLATEEVLSAPVAILPNSYGKQLFNAFQEAGQHRAELDVEISVEATGRNIPFEWVVNCFVETEADRAIEAIRDRQRARQKLRLAQEKQAQLIPPKGVID